MQARLFDCQSSSEYLARGYDQAKSLEPRLTIEKFAKRLGLGTSSMKMILSGKRKPTVKQMLAFAKASRLSHEETAYLETLALKDSARTSWEKAYYSKSLVKKRKEAKVSTRTTSQKSLLTDILAMPVMVDLLEKKPATLDPVELARRFSVPLARIEKILESLRQAGVLGIESDGRFHIAFDKFSHRPLQKKYLQGLLADASRRLENEYEGTQSIFASFSLSFTEEDHGQFRQELKNLMEQFMGKKRSPEQKTNVFQVSFQLMPLTKNL